MLPVKLTLQGINSYQKSQVIDFQNLIDNQIFGIFGEVGSGKSTIPEAISYALYGKTERLGRNDGISYNMMNLRSDTLLIDFEFKTQNESHYRFVVKGKRNSKNFEDVSFEKLKYEKVGIEWFPNEKLDAEELLGLNYDNFKRTIIIPQNKFMEFIQLGDSDRTKMLKEIFNLNKFDLYAKTRELEIESSQKLANLNGQLESLILFDVEQLKQKKSDLTINLESREIKEKELNTASMEFQEMNNLKILHDEINEAKNMFENLKSKKNDIDKLTEDLNKYKTCLYNFKSLIDNKNSLNAKLIADEKQQSIFSTELSKLQIIHKELNSKFVEIEKDYKNIEVQKDETDDLKKILGILKLDKSISEIQYKLDKNIEFKTEAENKFNTINSKLDDIKSNIKTLEKNLPDLKLLSKIKEWFLIKQQIKDSIGELESNLKQRKDKIVQIEREKVNISCNKSMSDLNLDFSLNIVELISDLKYKNDWYQKNVKKLISERESLNLKFKLKEFSESLEDGMPCPVCGALSHPDPLKIENVNLQLEKLNGRIVNGERLVDEINSCVEVLQGLNSRLTNEQSNISEIENKLLEKKNQLIKHNDLFKWDDFDSHNPESVDVELSKADLISKQIKTFKSEEEKTSTLKESLSKSFDVLKQENLDLNLHFKTNIAEKNLLLSQLSVLKYEDFVTKDNFFVEEYLKNKLLFIDDLIKNHNTLEKDIKEKEKQITLNQIKLDSVLKKIEEYKLDINDNSKEIEIKLIKFGFANEDEVKKILSQDIDIENSEKTIKEYELNFYNATNQIEKLKIKIGARVFDEKNYYVLKEKIENLNTSLDDIQMKIGALSNEIKDWEEKIITKKRLTKEINKLELRISDIKTLLSMFKGNGFVNFVSKIKLRELVNYANSRFNKLTRGRLSLQLNANNSFEIIDYLNDGKKRNIKSLSGGQLFQASLSLALALAGIVQSQNKNKQNFFFLDEGFGTQDEQSLNLVFEAISSLRQENRVVGLISHVAEMKENIYAYLDIRNDESVGSLITASWEK